MMVVSMRGIGQWGRVMAGASASVPDEGLALRSSLRDCRGRDSASALMSDTAAARRFDA